MNNDVISKTLHPRHNNREKEPVRENAHSIAAGKKPLTIFPGAHVNSAAETKQALSGGEKVNAPRAHEQPPNRAHYLLIKQSSASAFNFAVGPPRSRL